MCLEELYKTEVFSALAAIEDDEYIRYAIVSSCYRNRMRSSFLKWYKDKFNRTISTKDLLDTKKDKAKRIAERMRAYYYTMRPSIQATVRRNADARDVVYSQYPSISDREVGKIHSAVKVLKLYNRNKDIGFEIKGNSIDYYMARLKDAWTSELCACIAKARAERNSKIKDKDAERENVDVEAIAAELAEKQKQSNEAKPEDEVVDVAAWIDEQLGKDNKDIQAQNVLAVWKELNGDKAIALSYMNEVMADPILNSVRNADRQGYETFIDTVNKYNTAEESGTTVDGTTEINEDEYDRMIVMANSHDGLHSNFMVHLSERLFNYFNALPKAVSTVSEKGEMNIQRDPRWGIEECFTAEEITSVLYSINQNFMNIETMIDTIREYAASTPGYEGLEQLARDLENNPDFATEVATCFIKTVISKIQINVAGSQTKANVSNVRTNERTTMFFNAKSDMVSILADVNPDLMTKMLSKINDDANSIINTVNDGIERAEEEIATYKRYLLYKKNANGKRLSKEDKDFYTSRIEENEQYIASLEEEYNGIKDSIINAIKMYFPSMQEKAISAFIYQNNNAGNNIIEKLKNIKYLSSILTEINKTVPASKNAYETIQEERRKAVKYNNMLKAEQAKNNYVPADKFKDIAAILAQDPITSVNGMNRLVDALLPYTTVRLQLNSPNAKGNNASDVINNNYITHLKKIMEYTKKVPVTDDNGKIVRYKLENPALVAWGKQRMRSKQYKYSAILLEHTDANGETIPGIFREVDGELELTEHGPKLLEMYLFDGAVYEDQGNSATYSEMGQGGYLPSAYVAFHKTNAASNDTSGFQYANYMCRTPSDAPKNFMIKTIKHEFGDILIDADVNGTAAKIKSAIDGVKELSLEEVTAVNSNGQLDSYLFDDATQNNIGKKFEILADNIIQKKYRKDIPIDPSHIITNADGTSSIYVYLENKGSSTGDKYIFKFTGERVDSTTTRGVYFRVSSCDGVMHAWKSKFGNHTDKQMPDKLVETINKEMRNELEYRDVTINGKTYTQTKYVINKKSRGFSILKNLAKQDLLNIACAIDHYFDTDEKGLIYDSDPDLNNGKPKKIEIKEKAKHNGKEKGYAWYHTDKKGRVLVHEKGKYSLPGKGFHSNSFVVTKTVVNDKGEEEVVTTNYIDRLITTEQIGKSEKEKNKEKPFQLLYGGDTGNYLHVVKKIERDETGKVISEKVDDIELTEDQEEALDQALEDFVKDYIEQAGQEIRAKREFIHGVGVNQNNIVNFALNNFVWFHIADDIFDGSSAFYKDSQTQFKRAKQIQGAGVPYGIVDYLKVETDTPPQPITDSQGRKIGMLNTGTWSAANGRPYTIQSLFKGTILEGCLQRDKFYGVTIANTQMTNDVALQRLKAELMRTITDENGNVVKKGLSEERAMTLLYGPMEYDKKGNPIGRKGGFTEQKVNDAQSYITFDEWVRRVAARGQLRKYMPLITKLMDESVTLTTEDLKEFIQVQKNFYYDMWYDPDYEMYVPRQIKNAELVLVPRLIRGTELEQVYNMMKEAGVDQLNTVETSKAANEEILTLWDNNGDFHPEGFVENADRMKRTYDYSFLYTQQETPQHVHSSNKAGIQIVKKVIDNIPPGHKLYDKKQEYFRVFVQNIKDSYDKTMRSFNIPTDANGNIILDDRGNISMLHGKTLNKKVFYKRFRDELLRTGMDKNLIDYVTLDENGEPKMPAYFNINIRKLEQVAQSLFNSSITRQTLPGYHAAQVTNIGWKPLNENVENAAYCKELDYHPIQYALKVDPTVTISKRRYERMSDEEKALYEEAGAAPYIEIMLPASNFGIDRNSPHYRNMTDQQIIDELEAKGLDMTIGYRIPTEGKQSMCIMKVVGFTPDALGSTIVVPNDWVSQTGSDFDIDTVYGIHFETYKKHDGEIMQVPYVTFDIKNNSEEQIAEKKKKAKYTYWSYVNDMLKTANVDEDETKEVKDAHEALKQFNRQTVYNSLMINENKLFKRFPDWFRELSAKADATSKEEQKKEEERIGPMSEEDKYLDMLYNRLDAMEPEVDKLVNNPDVDSKSKQALKLWIALQNSIIALIENPDVAHNDDPIIRGLQDNFFTEFEEKAKAIGAKSFEDYFNALTTTPEVVNSRRARNNRILSLMIDILGDPTSLEENLSRSNFDDIIHWRNIIMSDNVTKLRKNRNPYNIFDQIKNQEDATSGLVLKGMSVAMDTFCSVCNTVRPTLTRSVYVVYDSNDFDEKGDNAPSKVVKRFGNGTVSGNTFSIKHTSYGYSNFDGNGDRNVVGKLITAYSSQTTAHILDAIKEGNIPGVNQFTFPVYKTIVNVGSDYKTAISFIMQPAIQKLVDNHEKYNSVFATGYGNPLHQTVREMIAELTGQKVDRVTNIHTLIGNFNRTVVPGTEDNPITFGQVFNEIFSQNEDEHCQPSLNPNLLENLPLIVPMLYDRIKGKGQFSNNKKKWASSPLGKKHIPHEVFVGLFDLGVICQFAKLNSIATNVGKLQRVCNPDKFGAKQTVYATNEVFREINEILHYDPDQELDEQGMTEEQEEKKKRKPILEVDGKHMLEVIYPGIEGATPVDPTAGMREHDIFESPYPTLYAYLRYASAPSIIVNKQLFDILHHNFMNAVEGIKTVMSGAHPRLDEETYESIQSFILATCYNDTEFAKFNVVVYKDDNEETKIVSLKPDINGKEEKDEYTVEQATEMEKNRVLGFGYPSGMKYPVRNGNSANGQPSFTFKNFKVEDLNNPTEKECEAFSKLTPAQKIKFIQTNFTDTGIFGLFTINLFNPSQRKRYADRQTIEFQDDGVASDTVYRLFYDAFNNDHPFSRMAAIDIIKYALIGENMVMTKRGITRVIDNKALLNTFGPLGVGLVGELDKSIGNIRDASNPLRNDEYLKVIYERYIRSHPDMKGIRTLYMNEKKAIDLGFNPTGKEGIVLMSYRPVEGATPEQTAEAITAFEEKMKDAGIMWHDPVKKMYYPNTYIRIKEGNDVTTYKIIHSRDTSEIFLCPLNKLDYNETSEWSAREDNNKYRNVHYYEALVQRYLSDGRITAIGDAIYAFDKEHNYKLGEFEAPKKLINTAFREAKDFNLELEASKGSKGMGIVLNAIKSYYSELNNDSLYICSAALNDYIYTAGKNYGSDQYLDLGDGRRIHVRIEKVNTAEIEEEYFKMRSLDDGKHWFFALDKDKFRKKIDGLRPISYRDIAIDARMHDRKPANVFKVVPVKDNTMYSAEENMAFEPEVQALEYMNVKQNQGEKAAIDSRESLRMKGVTGSIESIQKHKVEVNRQIAKYATDMANALYSKFYSFCPRPGVDGSFISILHDDVQQLLKSQADSDQVNRHLLLKEYMKLINDIKGFLQVYEPFDSKFIDDSDIETKHYITQIQEALAIVKKLPLNEAVHKLNDSYIASLSTNPLIRERAISVMDNYWANYGYMWKFNDIMESGNPLLQIILKDVMGDIDAKEKATRRIRREFRNKVADIEKRAKAAGKTINRDKFIDEDGRLKGKYTPEFADKYYELQEGATAAARQYGYGSIEHLKAKLAYDEFKAKHINQPAEQEYYLKKCEAERKMIEAEPVIYSAYMKLYYERLDIIRSSSMQGITQEDQDRLDDLQNAMRNLYINPNYASAMPGYYGTYVDENGNVQERPTGLSRTRMRIVNADNAAETAIDNIPREVYEENADPEVQDTIDMYGYDSAVALGGFILTMSKLNEEYFKYNSKYGFDDLLKMNLDIVRNKEDRDANGIPRKTQAELADDRAYQDARLWLARNAKFVINETSAATANPDSIVYKIKRAFAILKRGGNNKAHSSNQIIRDSKAYDAYGVVDGTLISDEDKTKMKKEIEDNYALHLNPYGADTEGLPEHCDKLLMSNANHNDVIYSQAFYNHLKSNGYDNPTYYRYVTGINKILEKYYDPIDGLIHLERAKDNPQGIQDLRTLAQAYQDLRYGVSRTEDATNSREVGQFIEENCTVDTNTEAFNNVMSAYNNDNARNSSRSDEFKDAFEKCQYELDVDGNYMLDEDGKRIPNRYLYTTIKPTEEAIWMDEERTEAFDTLNEAYRKSPTVYWYRALNEARDRKKNDPSFDFEQWYVDQHVYNPYTRKLELLDCWVTTELKEELFENNEYEAKWIPLASQREKVPNDGVYYLSSGRPVTIPSKRHINDNYNPDTNPLGNYIEGSGYDSNLELNEFEQELKDLYEDTLKQSATTSAAARFFEKGYLPRRRIKEEKNILSRVAVETGKAFGFAISDAGLGEAATSAAEGAVKSGKGKKKKVAFYDDIDYIKDKAPLPPMTQLLKDEKLGSVDFKEVAPVRGDFSSQEEFDEALASWTQRRKEAIEKNKEVNRKLLDRNWDDVIDEYLSRAGRYNAVEDNKQKLYYLLNQLREQKSYSREHGAYGELKKDDRHSTDGNVVYDMTNDKDLVEQYTNFLRRVLYDQWKRDEGVFTNFGRHLQGYTSANYMMLNLKAGIANVLVGEVNIIGEKLAREYMSGADWAVGSTAWITQSINMLRGLYTEVAYCKTDAVAKYFNVVDYDELNGVSRELDMEKYSKRVRDMMFAPQAITENFMQNSVLFGMLHAHRIISIDDDPAGIGCIYMNEAEYIRYRESKELMELLTPEQKQQFEEEKAKIVKDPDTLKEYAWWRRDMLTQFLVHHMNKSQRDAFVSKRKENQEKYKKEFAEKTSMWDQIDLGKDGFMSFKDGTDLAALHARMFDGQTTCAERICGLFSERVRKVNNKIHGVYNKMGQAYIESTWWGGLVMQYHKHLPMGLLRHYRARGYYNETRGTREKGMLQSLTDFLQLDAQLAGVENGWLPNQMNAVVSLQMILRHAFDVATQIGATWNLLQPEDKGNIRRSLADLGGVLSAIAFVVALMALGGDDDDEDGILFNLALYEADRMAAEVFLYNPIGLWTETKTLMSSPVAAKSIVSDIANFCINMGSWIANGGDYDMTYKSGRFAGENKLWVYFQRRLPIWNGIRGIIELPKNNNYFKLGRKPTSVASTINHWITGED